MAPMYRGENGIDNLNIDLQNIFNPASADKPEIHYADLVYRLGDKVLELINTPSSMMSSIAFLFTRIRSIMACWVARRIRASCAHSPIPQPSVFASNTGRFLSFDITSLPPLHRLFLLILG
jgi:hypothetical protein